MTYKKKEATKRLTWDKLADIEHSFYVARREIEETRGMIDEWEINEQLDHILDRLDYVVMPAVYKFLDNWNSKEDFNDYFRYR